MPHRIAATIAFDVLLDTVRYDIVHSICLCHNLFIIDAVPTKYRHTQFTPSACWHTSFIRAPDGSLSIEYIQSSRGEWGDGGYGVIRNQFSLCHRANKQTHSPTHTSLNPREHCRQIGVSHLRYIWLRLIVAGRQIQ